MDELNKFLGCEHFRFEGRVDGATSGSIHIDRERQVLHVRPFQGRVYSLRLEDVANLVLSRVVKNELASKGRAVPGPRR